MQSNTNIICPALIGQSRGIQRAVSRCATAARYGVNALIMGEEGTGKEMLARGAIHQNSDRRDMPLLQVDASFSDKMVEGELFGFTRGFMGFERERVGVLEAAAGGAVIITDVDTMQAHVQTRLYETLATGMVNVGSKMEKPADVVLLCTTTQDIHEMARQHQFRGDLLTRLSGIVIRLPALRDRKGDLELLLKAFMDEANQKYGKNVAGFDRNALKRLQIYNWPGNVRELANAVERAVALAKGSVIAYENLPPDIQTKQHEFAGSFTVRPGMRLGDVEDMLIEATLEASGGDIHKAASKLGVNPRMVQRKGRRHIAGGMAGNHQLDRQLGQ